MLVNRFGSAWQRAPAAISAILVVMLLSAAGPTGDADAGAAASAPSLAGKLLVAAASMPDPRFRHSVILMIDHTERGAVGLIVNKPMAEVDTARLFARLGLEHEGAGKPLTVFFGGPVEPKFSMVIHEPDFATPESRRVSDRLLVTPEAVVIAAMAKESGPRRAIFVVGYAGWGPGQLDGEMRRQDWHTAPADAALIFSANHDTKWQRAMNLRYRSL